MKVRHIMLLAVITLSMVACKNAGKQRSDNNFETECTFTRFNKTISNISNSSNSSNFLSNPINHLKLIP
jgi:hypothetical protein